MHIISFQPGKIRALSIFPVLLATILGVVLVYAVKSPGQYTPVSGDEAPKGVGDPDILAELEESKAQAVKDPSFLPANPSKTDPAVAWRYSRGQMSVHGFRCSSSCRASIAQKGNNVCEARAQRGTVTDSCSPRPNTDRFGTECTSPCRWHFDPFAGFGNAGYYWCYVRGGSWNGCGPHTV